VKSISASQAIGPGFGGPIPTFPLLFGLTSSNGRGFFWQRGGTYNNLWTSDGTSQGTVQLTPNASGPVATIIDVNGTLFFSMRTQLWKSDGTVAGTTMVSNVPTAGLGLSLMVNVNGTLFFSPSEFGGSPELSLELWKSDGTAAGTTLVKVI